MDTIPTRPPCFGQEGAITCSCKDTDCVAARHFWERARQIVECPANKRDTLLRNMGATLTRVPDAITDAREIQQRKERGQLLFGLVKEAARQLYCERTGTGAQAA